MAFVEIAKLTLRQGRRGTIGWLIGLGALTLLYGSSFKSIGGAKSAAVSNYPESLRKALNLGDLTSPVGYLNSTTFGIPLLVLTSMFVIGTATRAVAGDEEAGSLELLLTYPITRTGLVLARLAAMIASLAALGAVMFLVVLGLRNPTGLSIGAAHLASATLTWFLLGCCLGSIALLVSSATGQRSVSLGISAAVTAFAYLAGSFIPLVKHLGWMRDISPFQWFVGGNPLAHGLQFGQCGLLLATAAAATAGAVATINRRDLRT